ncbi:hypothetical protein LTR70_007066 [Exophiala xenobiotica]|uniref:Rad4-domain-containing protein n=1 Tax=Lithohypha guttulata TaxID=1690604 RepID=A0ABR0K6U0_9EURO|nr:hypothetical protein LTR24_006299 [Lithohypha guttulata]KAK5314629.1 hypothetical protein LTR70_007066 [Exophiala xenobiotica]
MPPFVGRKRRSPSPASAPPPPAKKVKTAAATNAAKKAAPTPQTKSTRLSSESDSDSSLSDVDSDELEDVPPPAKAGRTHKQPQPEDEEEDSESGDEDEDDFEDVPAQSTAPDFSNRDFKDINITVQGEQEPDYTARAATKKGPSRREKQARMYTHKMHVQLLLWHNSMRNGWVNDKKVHEILLKHLPAQIVKEIEKWRRASGLVKQEEQKPSPKESKKKTKKWKANGERNERDWGRPSQVLEEVKPNMSNGDPIISLLKVLAAFWKKKFAITAPGLRKRGYGTKLGLRKDIESYRNEKHHPAKHGEKIETLEHFRKAAGKCEGSRDAGAQLFTALLRAIGVETRMVASLQPAGFGFTKAEELVPRKIVDPESSSSLDDESTDVKKDSKSTIKSNRSALASKKKSRAKRPRGGKTAPIELDPDSEVDLSSGDESVVDVTPSMPNARPAKYDKDLAFPIYWAEAVSPITSKVYPVSPFLLENPVATSAELLSTFEPRGAKAEKARQVMAYVVAHSSDYSGKDVTLRYLRKRLWPGKTKGFRVPVEKVPIYDQRGKVKRYEDYDWFKHVLSIYCRSDKDRSAVDDLEDSTDLIPAEPEKKEIEGDTLQSLKQSAEFVIEKHLRREEALVPGSKPVRTFTTGKGDKQEDHQIYKRTDVRKVMTAESWHKEGRAPREGETPMKLAPVRAVTLARKREAEAHLIRTGEKQMQGLYAEDQTDWIIPPPIENGVIPKNAYGNIDCFVPSMVPKGAVHVPLKGTVRICKKLEIDYAEAVVGFEFGNKMAVPVILGVVIAKENEKPVRDAWRIYSEEQRKKEETKMEKLVLDLWGKFYRGLIIRARVHEQYGLDLGSGQANTGASRDEAIHLDDDVRPAGGGFMPEHDENDFGGGFLIDHEDDHHPGSDLELEAPTASQKMPTVHDNGDENGEIDASQGYPTPVSASVVGRTTGKPKSKLEPRGNINKHVVEDSGKTDSSGMSDIDQTFGREEEITEAGGFLMDDDGGNGRLNGMDIDKLVVNDELTNASTDLNSGLEGNEKIRPLPGLPPRSRDRPRKSAQAATKETPKTRTATRVKATPASTRKTPSRSAKSRIPSLNVDGVASEPSESSSSSASESQVQPDSELSETTPPPAKTKAAKATAKAPNTSHPIAKMAKAKPTVPSPTNGQGGRGRPRKSKTTDKKVAIPTKDKKLPRKESTVVTSPYFEQA